MPTIFGNPFRTYLFIYDSRRRLPIHRYRVGNRTGCRRYAHETATVDSDVATSQWPESTVSAGLRWNTTGREVVYRALFSYWPFGDDRKRKIEIETRL